jgi:hypothetical protein
MCLAGREAFQRAVGRREPVRIEYRARRENGSWRQRDVVDINRLKDSTLAGVVVNYRNTSIVSVETALLERERRTAEQPRAGERTTATWPKHDSVNVRRETQYLPVYSSHTFHIENGTGRPLAAGTQVYRRRNAAGGMLPSSRGTFDARSVF